MLLIKFNVNLNLKFKGMRSAYNAARILICSGLDINIGIKDEEEKLEISNRINELLEVLPGRNRKLRKYLTENQVQKKFTEILDDIKKIHSN